MFENEIDFAALFGVEGNAPDPGTASSAPSGGTFPKGEGYAAGTGAAGTDVPNSGTASSAPSGGTFPNGEGYAAGNNTAGADAPDTGTEADVNARYASIRRKEEQRANAAIAQAKADAERSANEAIAALGLQDPYAGKPITTLQELQAYRRAKSEEQKGTLLKRSGMTGAEFDEFVAGLPEVQEARAAAAAAEAEKQRANEEAAGARVAEQLREITALDPTIKELSDLARMPNYPRFYELVQRGNTLVDAYRLANFDALTGKAASASRQAAINSLQGKQHLAQTAQRGSGGVEVPAAQMELYRFLNPGVSDEEIRAHYAKSVKT